MFYRSSKNTLASKSVVKPDFRIEVFDAGLLDVEIWAPYNVFGFVFQSESTRTRLSAGDFHDDDGTLPSGTFGLIPACTETKISENGPVTWLAIMLRPLYCCGVAYEFPDAPVFRLRNAGIEIICRGLADELEHVDFRNSAPFESKVAALLSAISAITAKKDPVRSGLDPVALARVVEMIEANLTDRLTNDSLADVVGLSVDTFRRKFHESTGVPTHKYIARLRSARARHLIEEGRMSLAEVSLEAGYCSQAHMSRMFLETFGVSPGRFKRMRA